MNASQLEALDNEITQIDMLILASEQWSSQYAKDPKTHAKLIKAEASYAAALRKYFRDSASSVATYVDWNAYNAQVNAAVKVQTIVQEAFFDGLDNDFMKVSLQYIALGTALGAESSQNIYKFPVGIASTDSIIQQLALDRLAGLVGKKIDKDGNVVDNPRSDYRISDKTRQDVASSVKTSVALGEDRDEALQRMQKVISDPNRASNIAQTEIVNAHSEGVMEYGRQSQATGKESLSVGAVDECQDFADIGIVDIGFQYADMYDGPAYHPNCRCGIRLVYRNEYDPDK